MVMDEKLQEEFARRDEERRKEKIEHATMCREKRPTVEKPKAQDVIRRSVAFEEVDITIVSRLAEMDGYGSRGFSAALRKIIREWAKSQGTIYVHMGRHADIVADGILDGIEE